MKRETYDSFSSSGSGSDSIISISVLTAFSTLIFSFNQSMIAEAISLGNLIKENRKTLYFVTTCDAIRAALQRAGASYQLGSGLLFASPEGTSIGSILAGALAGFLASIILIMIMRGGKKWVRR